MASPNPSHHRQLKWRRLNAVHPMVTWLVHSCLLSVWALELLFFIIYFTDDAERPGCTLVSPEATLEATTFPTHTEGFPPDAGALDSNLKVSLEFPAGTFFCDAYHEYFVI